MRTLNEQIQRVKDALVTCYNAIKRKGGTIPEAGERTLLNMPAAVLSIPQIHGVLTELNVTANGEYLPSDYDADGFSKVTAEFDTSSLPKVKVFEIRVSNNCFDNGYWNGNNIDVHEVTTLNNTFFTCYVATKIDVKTWDTSNVTQFVGTFQACSKIVELDISNWNSSRVASLNNMFYGCISLEMLDLRNWDCNSVSSANNTFYNCKSLTSLIGGIMEEQVDMNTISCLNGFKISIDLSSTILDRASLRAVINGLADLTGQTAQTLTLGATLTAKLTEEDIAIATNKNWTIS